MTTLAFCLALTTQQAGSGYLSGCMVAHGVSKHAVWLELDREISINVQRHVT